MRLNVMLVVLALGLLTLSVNGSAHSQHEAGAVSELIGFELKDQFDEVYTDETFRGNNLVLLGSDRGGSEFNAPWGRAIRRALADEGLAARQVGLSDLRSVPGFLKGTIKRRFPKERSDWVLMDWKGVFPKTYGFTKKHANVLVFDAMGTLIHQVAVREVEEKALREIVAAIRQSG